MAIYGGNPFLSLALGTSSHEQAEESTTDSDHRLRRMLDDHLFIFFYRRYCVLSLCGLFFYTCNELFLFSRDGLQTAIGRRDRRISLLRCQ